MGTAGTRGPYRKGRERRERILEAALLAYATAGTSGPTLKAIAAEVGLTETAVLHYFSGRDELFTAVVRARDENAARDHPPTGGLRRYAGVVGENARTPGLVRLFLEVSAAASSPEHPGHAYFRERYRRLVDGIAAELLTEDPGGDPERARWTARTLVAAVDGLQLQWLHDPSIDMVADLERLVAQALRAARS